MFAAYGEFKLKGQKKALLALDKAKEEAAFGVVLQPGQTGTTDLQPLDFKDMIVFGDEAADEREIGSTIDYLDMVRYSNIENMSYIS